MNIANITGTIVGYPLGVLTGTISFMRNSRMFHPVGVLVKAEVKNLKTSVIKFPPFAMMRFSSAWWKNKEWIDVLGISIRFTDDYQDEKSRESDQDLLFATIVSPWQMPLAPFMTHFRDFFKNIYYAVSPFIVSDQLVYFKLTTLKASEEGYSRLSILKENIYRHAGMELWMRRKNEAWVPVAELTLLHELNLDQRRLRFNPFLNGLNIKPYGFVHHLRIGAYRFSQFGRSFRHRIEKIFNRVDDRVFIHRL